MPNEIQQPKQFDIVGDPVLVGGIGQGFEATLNWRVHDGHDERTGFFNVGGGSGEHGQFQVAAAIGKTFTTAPRSGCCSQVTHSGESTTGCVLGMQQTEVNPPAAAAAVPVAMVSL